MNQQVHNLLGLMARARVIDVGAEKIYDGMKKAKYLAVVVAEDAQPKTAIKMERLAETHQVQLIKFGTKEQLARAIGKELTVALAIKDKGFYEALDKLMKK